MKKKIVIFGAGGMLGSMVLDVFAKDDDFSVVATYRDSKEIEFFKKYRNVKFIKLDVEYADENVLKKVMRGASFVINCIGIIKPYIHDDNAREVERAVRINALFPQLLAKAAGKTKIIQIATDCVYSGEKKGGYKESDPHDALDVYGKTKSIGEAYFRNIYHLRCSIIGPELVNHLSLMDWFLTQPKGAQVQGWKNHYWNGLTTYHFAKLCAGIIKKDIKINHLQHVIPADTVSKYQMLKIFSDIYGRSDIKIAPTNVKQSVNRTLATENARVNEQLWKAAGYNEIPSIKEMVFELGEYSRGVK